jgi:hypothetical protein
MNKREKSIDHTGQRFGRLTAVRSVKNKGWECLCDCGNIRYSESYMLKKGKAKSCGCITKRDNNQLYKSKVYTRWQTLVGKDIISEEFKNFKTFEKYIYNVLKPKHYKFSIIRIDKSKKFEVNNLKIKIHTHKKELYGKSFIWCPSCERYILDTPKFYSNHEKESCKICKYKNVLKKEYNLEYEDYIKMLNKNKSSCEICNSKLILYGKNKTSCIDHCHKTNKVRGVICQRCNSALGMFKDSTQTIRKTIEYLERGDTKIEYNRFKKNIVDKICPITNCSNNLVCDHNHKTGFIRGNINENINLAIGLLKDSVENLENAIKYLEKERD